MPRTLGGGAGGLREDACDLVRPALDARLVHAFDHDARLALGPGVADEDAAIDAQLALDIGDELLDVGELIERDLALDREVDEDLRRALHDLGELRERATF